MPESTVTIAAPTCGCEIEVTLTTDRGSTNDPYRTVPCVDRIETPTACAGCGRTFDSIELFVIDARAERQWEKEREDDDA